MSSIDDTNEYECLHCKEPIQNRLDMIKPCECEFGIYHKECIEKWIKYKPKSQELNKCEMCKTVYKNINITEIDLNTLTSKKAIYIANIICLSIIILYIYICTLENDDSGYTLFIGLLIFYCIVPIYYTILSIIDCRNYFPLLRRNMNINIINGENYNNKQIKISFNDDVDNV